MAEQYSCGVCKFEVNDNDDSVQCNLCDRWNDINCVEINKQKYEKLTNDPLPSLYVWNSFFFSNKQQGI